MTIATFVYSIVVAALVGVAAAALDALLRLGRRPARGVWAAALCITVIGTALAPLRGTSVPAPGAPELGQVIGAASPAPLSLAERIAQPFVAARRAVAAIADRALAHIPGLHSATLDRWLGASWFIASLVLLLLLAAFHAHFRRARRAWPRATVDGIDVRLAPRTGPAVMGLLAPEIVVPTWLVSRDAAERRLVLDHEREHLRAHDPLLLAGAYAAAVLVPWHPVVWWMLARLRLAVEVDCDARVLGHGVAPRRYGALLIDLSARQPAAIAGMPALGLTLTNLERRLIAMTPHQRSSTYLRRGALAAIALVAFAIACEAPVPTAANEPQTVAASHTYTTPLWASFVAPGDSAVYRIDGMVVSPAQAESLHVSGGIATLLIKSVSQPNEPKRINFVINTKPGVVTPDGRSGQQHELFKVDGPTDGMRLKLAAITADSHNGELPKIADSAQANRDRAVVAQHMATSTAPAFTGLVFINGQPSTRAALQQLPPERIQSVNVFKGAKAAAMSSDPRAANGVIAVTTKP